MDDRTRLMFLEQSADGIGVTNISVDKHMSLVAFKAGEIIEIAGVSQFVNVDDRFLLRREPI